MNITRRSIVHFRVRSSAAAKGIRAANILFHRFVIHPTRDAFAAALGDEILQARSV
jgi:hypothetical protein